MILHTLTADTKGVKNLKSIFLKKDAAPSCGYCKYGQVCRGTDTVVCLKRGLSTTDEHCRAFKYDPIKRIPKKRPTIESFSKDDFEL